MIELIKPYISGRNFDRTGWAYISETWSYPPAWVMEYPQN